MDIQLYSFGLIISVWIKHQHYQLPSHVLLNHQTIAKPSKKQNSHQA